MNATSLASATAQASEWSKLSGLYMCHGFEALVSRGDEGNGDLSRLMHTDLRRDLSLKEILGFTDIRDRVKEAAVRSRQIRTLLTRQMEKESGRLLSDGNSNLFLFNAGDSFRLLCLFRVSIDVPHWAAEPGDFETNEFQAGSRLFYNR